MGTFEDQAMEALENTDWMRPQTSQALVELVSVQVKEEKDCLECNLNLLKFYNFYPQLFDVHVVRLILVKALMSLPDTDFTEALSQIPENNTAIPEIAELIELEEILQNCQFVIFWRKVESESLRPLLKSVAGFHRAIRKFMAGVISSAYKNISLQELLLVLALAGPEEPEFQRLCKEQGWQVKESTVHMNDHFEEPAAGKDASQGLSTTEMLAKCIRVLGSAHTT